MSDIWGLAGIIGSAGITAAGSWFTLRATHRATQAGIEAQQAVARITTEPDQRGADLAAFRQIQENMQTRNDRLEARQTRLETLVRAFSLYVTQLSTQMRQRGMEPPAPPAEVEDYRRTGV